MSYFCSNFLSHTVCLRCLLNKEVYIRVLLILFSNIQHRTIGLESILGQIPATVRLTPKQIHTYIHAYIRKLYNHIFISIIYIHMYFIYNYTSNYTTIKKMQMKRKLSHCTGGFAMVNIDIFI